ncbi:hypothetical protein EBR78_09335, partial [bacterium]|nr:hypothetical protein [bacterium]
RFRVTTTSAIPSVSNAVDVSVRKDTCNELSQAGKSKRARKIGTSFFMLMVIELEETKLWKLF